MVKTKIKNIRSAAIPIGSTLYDEVEDVFKRYDGEKWVKRPPCTGDVKEVGGKLSLYDGNEWFEFIDPEIFKMNTFKCIYRSLFLKDPRVDLDQLEKDFKTIIIKDVRVYRFDEWDAWVKKMKKEIGEIKK